MYEREKFLYAGKMFVGSGEEQASILSRHQQFLEPKGLQVNHRLPYIYGIWKSAKRSLRWISGVKKLDKESEIEGRPKGSIAGAGDELVGVLNSIMQSLRRKDNEGRRQGNPKKCWFIESVEEVAQPLRFNAKEVAAFKATATTKDFVTMYPAFDQTLLKARLEDAIKEAWTWEEQRSEDTGAQRLRRNGWVTLSPEELKKEIHGNWTLEEVIELVHFVLDNGYIRRGQAVLHQVKGFGMGLACAPQIANLGCYLVERDFAATRDPRDVEHNYRFIDDILTLSGCIPTEQEYQMEYKETRVKEGDLIYLGMELKWQPCKSGTKFTTGMHFRDATYPIKIRRYPAEGSMITDSQRLGVVTGQFIRAQRLCSTLQMFKAAVQEVVLAGVRRGYLRGELDRMWGKFLVRWWKAEEVRRGELRAWFRRMSRVVQRTVSAEVRKIVAPKNTGWPCKYSRNCWYKDKFCPFSHPVQTKKQAPEPTCLDKEGVSTPEIPSGGVPRTCPTASAKENIPKKEGRIWWAVGDGSCLFYCIQAKNDKQGAMQMRKLLANFVAENWDRQWEIPHITTRDLVLSTGIASKEAYLKEVVKESYWAGEVELVLLSKMTKSRLRIFKDSGKHWQEYVQYGDEGPLHR